MGELGFRVAYDPLPDPSLLLLLGPSLCPPSCPYPLLDSSRGTLLSISLVSLQMQRNASLMVEFQAL